jgi:ABC-type polysaccharide/polyol phosphate export permease
VKSATHRQISLALKDLIEGTRNWRIWYVLGISEVRQRYRRSMLGPLWVTLTVGIQALVMGLLLSFLFQTDINRQLPFICISLVTWTFITGAINDGAGCFIGMNGAILQVKRPLWTYMMLTLWRNAIIYAHTVIVFIFAAIAFRIFPSPIYLLALPGLALLVVNMGWMALVAGLISARFRDVPLLISNLFTVLVWLTPVYYESAQLGPRTRMIIEFNPLTHILEVARAPFLNQTPPLAVWVSVVGVAIFGWGMTIALFARTRARVAFWV